jgi:hypothetical protein
VASEFLLAALSQAFTAFFFFLADVPDPFVARFSGFSFSSVSVPTLLLVGVPAALISVLEGKVEGVGTDGVFVSTFSFKGFLLEVDFSNDLLMMKYPTVASNASNSSIHSHLLDGCSATVASAAGNLCSSEVHTLAGGVSR